MKTIKHTIVNGISPRELGGLNENKRYKTIFFEIDDESRMNLFVESIVVKLTNQGYFGFKLKILDFSGLSKFAKLKISKEMLAMGGEFVELGDEKICHVTGPNPILDFGNLIQYRYTAVVYIKECNLIYEILPFLKNGFSKDSFCSVCEAINDGGFFRCFDNEDGLGFELIGSDGFVAALAD